MVVYKNVGLIVFLSAALIFAKSEQYEVPKVQFDALKKGGFRVSIPAVSGIKRFSFDANINEDLPSISRGKLNADIHFPTNGFLVKEFDNALKVGDIIHYYIYVSDGSMGYQRFNLSWMVAESDLQDSYAPLGPPCRTSITTVNNGQTSCVGELIIFDEFLGPTVNRSKWTIEHKIPTYEGINNELNSYENRDDTRFIKEGIVYLKPIPLQKEEEVRGILDLKHGCTSSDVKQCYYEQRGAYLLPPVKAARITSKIPFKYGKVDIKARLPTGEWLVPVIELESKEKDSSGFAPKIFIAYSRGNDHLIHSSGHDIGSRLLYAGPVFCAGIKWNENLIIQRRDKPYSSDFHLYTLEWLPGIMSFYIDSQLYGTINTMQNFSEFGSIGTVEVDTRQNFSEIESACTASEAPFDKECLLSLGVAVGGQDYFPDGYVSGNNPRPWNYNNAHFVYTFFNERNVWSSTWKGDSSALQIDYVKVQAAE